MRRVTDIATRGTRCYSGQNRYSDRATMAGESCESVAGNALAIPARRKARGERRIRDYEVHPPKWRSYYARCPKGVPSKAASRGGVGVVSGHSATPASKRLLLRGIRLGGPICHRGRCEYNGGVSEEPHICRRRCGNWRNTSLADMLFTICTVRAGDSLGGASRKMRI